MRKKGWFALFGAWMVVVIGGVAFMQCGGFPKVVDEPPGEVVEEPAPERPPEFVNQDSVFKYKGKCFRLSPGGGVLTLVRVDCP